MKETRKKKALRIKLTVAQIESHKMRAGGSPLSDAQRARLKKRVAWHAKKDRKAI